MSEDTKEIIETGASRATRRGAAVSVRCRHRNAELLEVAEEWISHNFEDGNYTDSWHNAGDILPPLIVVCNDCKRRLRFTQNHHPKWVDEMIDKVHGNQSEVQP